MVLKNFDRVKSKFTLETAFPAWAVLNKSRHYSFREMIYHDERGFWSDYEHYLGDFCLRNVNHRHFDVSSDKRIREAANPAHDAGPLTHGRRPLFLRRISNLQPRVNNCSQCKIWIYSRPSQATTRKTTASTKIPAWYQNPLDIIRQRLLGEPIQTWVPGYEITVLFWFPNENGKFDVSAEGIPAKTTIKISYTDGYKKPTHYSDIFELNAVLLFGTTKPKTPVHRIQTDLQNIHQELKSLREGCGFPQTDISNKY